MTWLVWCIIILAFGLGLIFLELFVPSGGALSFFAAVAVLSAVVLAYVKCGMVTGSVFLMVGVILVPATIAFALRIYPNTPIGRRILAIPPSQEEITPQDELLWQRQTLKGQIGIAKTPLLPGGTVKLDKKSYAAVSEGEAVNAGDAVLVVRIEPRHLVVRRVEDDLNASADQPDRDDILASPVNSLGLESMDDPLA